MNGHGYISLLDAKLRRALEKGKEKGWGENTTYTPSPKDTLETSTNVFEDRSQSFVDALKGFLENDNTDGLEDFQVKFGMVQRNSDGTGTVDLKVSKNGERIGKFTISSTSAQCNGAEQYGCIKHSGTNVVLALGESNVKHFISTVFELIKNHKVSNIDDTTYNLREFVKDHVQAPKMQKSIAEGAFNISNGTNSGLVNSTRAESPIFNETYVSEPTAIPAIEGQGTGMSAVVIALASAGAVLGLLVAAVVGYFLYGKTQERKSIAL